MIAVATLAGIGFAAGLCLLISGLRPKPVAASSRRSTFVGLAAQFEGIDHRKVWVAVGVGIGVALVTRWPVAALGAAAVGWLLPLPGERGSQDRVEARTEAIALWTEMLRDAAGTARGIEGMLTATAASAPVPIRAEVQRMARRLEYEPLAVALDGLAADLAHPIGDLVVTALRLAATAGSRRVRLVLDDLSVAAHQEASMHRRVDVARQRPRTTMRLVTIIVGLFIAGMLIFARTYLAPYGTALGQVVLGVVAIYWAIGFWWMSRMGRLPQVERFLATSGGAS
jgi:Flp pilus assembly protein TadB